MPEPDGPSIVKNSPLPIRRSTPASASTPPKVLRTSLTSTAGTAPSSKGARPADGSAGTLVIDSLNVPENLRDLDDATKVQMANARRRHWTN